MLFRVLKYDGSQRQSNEELTAAKTVVRLRVDSDISQYLTWPVSTLSCVVLRHSADLCVLER